MENDEFIKYLKEWTKKNEVNFDFNKPFVISRVSINPIRIDNA